MARTGRGRIGSALLGAVLLIALGTATTGRAQTLSGLDLYRTRCDGCHELPEPDEPKRSRIEWDQILTRMIRTRGAVVSPPEKTALLNYLDSFNRPAREIRWVETPARSRKAAFPSAQTGKLPEEWVDLTLGADETIPWAIQGDARSTYVQPLKGAAENQFPSLLDNTGVVQSGTSRARFQLLAGKSPGAGLLFGYRSPQSYFGVRVAPQNAVLYEVQGGQRALRARAGVGVTLKEWHTVAVEIKGKAVQISLDGKPLPDLTRTLEGYRGGRCGIHTQGDTLARFDQWELMIP